MPEEAQTEGQQSCGNRAVAEQSPSITGMHSAFIESQIWCMAPAASQSLPPRARTQPVALGLCLKIAQASAICLCFSRQNKLCFWVSCNEIGCFPRSFWQLFSISNPKLLIFTRTSESFVMPQRATCLMCPETTFTFPPAPPCW